MMLRRSLAAWLHRGSVQRRLSLLLVLCAGITAAFSLVAVLLPGVLLENRRARDESESIARMLAYALQAPLAFQDEEAVNEALSVLRARPEIHRADAYDRQGWLIARYGQAADVRPLGPFDGHVRVALPVVVAGDRVGEVVVVYNLEQTARSLALVAALVAAGIALGFALAMVYARRLARGIVGPITQLAVTSTRIAHSKDYSQRLSGAGDDEIGHAVAAFNRMLDEVQLRDAALAESNHTLEQRVAERTREFEQQKERAIAASAAKTRFLANMSHELRTPLNAVIGAAQLLQQPGGAAPQDHLVGTIRESGVALLGLIENVLDVSRIEADALVLSDEPFDLIDCVESAVATAAVTARAKGLAIAACVDAELPARRRGDAVRLRQVLLNLLGNAVKFTRQGEVVLTVQAGATSVQLRLAVRDTGIGIDLARARDIFEPFTQADESTTRRFGGTGLGLTISRRLVQAMHGSIEVQSTPGAGTCFEVVLDLPVVAPDALHGEIAPHAAHPDAPHAAPAAAEAAPAVSRPLPLAPLGLHPALAPAPLAGHRVVFHEPHEASALALAALLARLGAVAQRCRGAADLRAALSHRRRGNAACCWVLIAVDGVADAATVAATDAMTDMTADVAGLWACAARRLPPSQLIAMVQDPTAPSALPAGAGPALIKPVLRSALLGRLQSGTPDGDRATTAAGHAAHVLVVEDDAVNRMIVGSMLQGAGFSFVSAEGGHAALRLLETQDFDLVLMDWHMPDMDGLEVTRRIRAGAAGAPAAAVPIVALTANAFAEDRRACLDAGMNDFLTKPVLATALVDIVRRWSPQRSEHPGDTEPAAELG
jgi:signal transduction histidine kinase/CheY-like chemotaxis protein